MFPAILSPRGIQSRLKGGPRGFTLVEMLVSIVILAIILGVIFGVAQLTARVNKNVGGQTEAFRSARNAFESMTRNLSLATLNNYYDYVDATGATRGQAIQANNANSFTPTGYARSSDLHFVSGWYSSGGGLYSKQVTHSCFFQAPLGYTAVGYLNNLENMLNACGYYIEYRNDPNEPSFVSSTAVYRYRLMEFIQPAESLTVYTTADTSWFTQPLQTASPPVHQLAQNIIALIILPRSTSADTSGSGGVDPITNAVSNYIYDTRANTSVVIHNQLPPIVEVAMVAVDEASFSRLLPNTATPPNVIQTALTTNGRFQTASNLDSDLTGLESDLATHHINYRVFRTLVPLRNSKWSTQ